MPAPVYDEWVTRARTLLCVVLALLLSTLGIGPARADEVPSGRVQLTVVTPTVLDAEHPGTGLTLRGTFTNTTGVPLYWVDAEVWHRSGLTTFDDVDAAIDSHATAPTGVRHRPGASLATSTPLAPGASTPFTLRVPLAALDLADDQVATVVGVDVRAATSATGTRETVGRERALLPHASQPFRLTDLVFLTARAGTRPGSRAVTDELAEQIVGPLTERLAESETPGVTTVIDPAVYRAATLLAADERNPSPASAEFVRRVDALRDAGRLWRTPHGNPNLARMPDRLRAQASTWADELAPEALADGGAAPRRRRRGPGLRQAGGDERHQPRAALLPAGRTPRREPRRRLPRTAPHRRERARQRPLGARPGTVAHRGPAPRRRRTAGAGAT